jgi:hypothetical protein
VGRALSGSLDNGRDSVTLPVRACALNEGDVGLDDACERGGVPGSETCSHRLNSIDYR